jgi:hypothetical protein
MADSSLSVHDRELFLAEPHIAALSVSAGPGRGPLTLPIWYQYEPGGEAWVLTEAGSWKARYLPPEKVPAYLEFAHAELGEQVAIYLRPQRWLTADLGPG